MKIAIPTDRGQAGAKVNAAFARAPFFYIYDTEKDHGIYADNSAAIQSGGAGVKAAQLLADKDVEVLLAPKCGENAAEVLREANIKIFKSEGDDPAGNVNAYLKGILAELTETEAGHHK